MNIQFRVANGRVIHGRTEEWVSAIIMVLTQEQREKVFGLIENKMVAAPVPGSHILQAGSVPFVLNKGQKP